MIEKLFVLAQIDVWECLGLSIVDLGQLIALEAAPKTYSKKVEKSILKPMHNLGFSQTCLGTPLMALLDIKVVCIGPC